MTEIENTTPPSKKNKLILPITLAIILVAATGFLISRAGFDKALVKQKLDAFVVQLREKGRTQGRDVNFTYGELEVVGSFTDKHVVIHNPALFIKPLADNAPPADANRPNALVITSPTMEIYPAAKDLSALRAVLPQPIDFAPQAEPTKSLLKITSATPLAVTVAQNNVNNVPFTKVDFVAPTQIDLVYMREQQGKGPEEATPVLVPVYETLRVALAAGSHISTDFAADGSDIGTGDLQLSQIVLTPQAQPEGAITIAEMTGKWSNQLNEKRQNSVAATYKLGPVTAPEGVLPYAPIALAADVAYTGSMPKTPEAVAGLQAEDSSFALNHFSITTKDAGLNATANFTANASDTLPVGNANLAITNAAFVLEQLKKYGLLNEANQPLVDALLLQITGTPAAELKDVNVAIERTRGGAFKIGNTTFEELFATVLKQAMQPKNGALPAPTSGAIIAPGTKPGASVPTPQLPPADKPKLKAIPVPDAGVRG